MTVKKADRKARYQEVMGLMLKNENKEAFEKLRALAADDVEFYALANYDAFMAKYAGMAEGH